MTASISSGQAGLREVLADTKRRLYNAEGTLHAARQSGVDAWVKAAYDRLHLAVADYLKARDTLEQCVDRPTVA